MGSDTHMVNSQSEGWSLVTKKEGHQWARLAQVIEGGGKGFSPLETSSIKGCCVLFMTSPSDSNQWMGRQERPFLLID